jgi:uncharacterized membrane protein YfcA
MSMALSMLVLLIIVFLLTSIISVVTGSTSLITVPVMLQIGVDAHVAVATNMFALTWMSVGGTLPFLQTTTIDRHRLAPLVILTLIGSIAGALLLLVIPSTSLPVIIAVAMLGITAFSLVNHQAGVVPVRVPTHRAEWSGYIATFVLGIYGGFFSGGYVTLLTAAYVALFGMTYVEAIAITKVINIFSSAVATIIFMLRGVVDYRLGVVLGLAMFIGALIGSRAVLRMNNIWLRRIFLATVIILALKTLLYDVF